MSLVFHVTVQKAATNNMRRLIAGRISTFKSTLRLPDRISPLMENRQRALLQSSILAAIILTLVLCPAIQNNILAQNDERTLQAVFDSLDKNKDGKLTADEFSRPLIFRRLDRNRDGALTFEESRAAISRFMDTQTNTPDPSGWEPNKFVNEIPKDAPFTKESILAAAEYSASHKGLSFIVYYDGKLIYEDYPNGGKEGRANELASGTKSFSGVIAAAAVADGFLDLDEKVSDTIDEWKNDKAKEAITVRQLLQLTSGINPEGDGPLRVPEYEEAIGEEMVASPGEKFAYGPVPFQCFGELMKRKLAAQGKGESVYDYLKRRILDPIGLDVGRWANERSGDIRLPSGCSLTAQEWAKFGEFIRLEGAWDGKQIIPAEILAECFKGSEANPAYGITFWLNQKVTAQTRRRIPQLRFASDDLTNIRQVPDDLVFAAGAGKQRCFISQDGKFVVARQASGVVEAVVGRAQRGFTDAQFLKLLLAAD